MEIKQANTGLGNVLMIGYVWPEPRSSAAGIRTEQLIRAVKDSASALTFASVSKENEASAELQARGIRCVPIQLNHPGFDAWIREERFDLVIFDRFVTEEQFGWRVAEASPDSIRVLDTSDLHFLRRTRQKALAAGADLRDIFEDRLDFMTQDAFREVAAIYRADLSLLVSDHEVRLLETRFGVPAHLLKLAPIGYFDPPRELPAYHQRQGFATIGNFRHPPNVDGNLWLKQEVWPRIRAALPRATLHIYGAYPARKDMDFSDPRQGFFVEGPAPDSLEALQKHRVILAPLRFGAGIKGKIADSWRSGAPVVTTPVGAEGMRLGHEFEFGGLIARDAESLAQAAVRLHEDSVLWEAARATGLRTLHERLDGEKLNQQLIQALLQLRAGILAHRSQSFISRMLSQQAFQGTKYFSKWIEAKALAQIKAVEQTGNDQRVSAPPEDIEHVVVVEVNRREAH
jgi:glycosyltransferase involved in cell wall biosynthesis